MPVESTDSIPPALRSVRGLILGVNSRGQALDPTVLRQWIGLSAEKFKVQKVDLYLPHGEADTVLPLLGEASREGIRLSLRTTPETSPDILPVLAEAGLLDVALEPGALCVEALRPWFDRAAAAGLPIRLFVKADHIPAQLDDALVDLVAGAASAQIALQDGIADENICGPLPEDTIDRAIALTEALIKRDTEVHCLGIPFCQVPEPLWPAIAQGPQLLAGHQHYRASAYDFACTVKNLSPMRIGQAVEIALGEGTSFHNRIDNAVLPWILERPWYFFWLWFLHKLTRRLGIRQPKPVALPETLTELEAELARNQTAKAARLGPTCAQCALHPICDGHTGAFKRAFPKRSVAAQPGPTEFDPRAFMTAENTWYDAVDLARCRQYQEQAQRADEARRRLTFEPPTREIAAESYSIEDHVTHRMPASVRWFSFSTAMLQSTVLARLSPPFTLSVTVGGGIAQLMGFAIGRHARLLCPMTRFDHKLALHVDADGHYLLLRDNEVVAPVAFADGDAVPERLGTVVEPRIALANIDGQIVTQTVLLWEGAPHAAAVEPCAHSVIIVCTRYARRLQAALMALAHQADLAPGALEVIVGYVPGVDATDDVLDGIGAQFPAMRIVRAPFATQYAHSKGFIINECLSLAGGAWITLLDADIMLPPDYFRQLDSLPTETMLAAPDGRHMLTREATAEVLLGLVRPWEDYEAGLALPGDYRHHESDGVPPGFCQSVRRAVFDTIRYQELDHFEGSDWWFSAQVIEKFGKETRLSGLRVLHLDHGGSQWYGTDRHF